MRQLHVEWFPLRYEQNFYATLLDPASLAVVAALPPARGSRAKSGPIVGLVSCARVGEDISMLRYSRKYIRRHIRMQIASTLVDLVSCARLRAPRNSGQEMEIEITFSMVVARVR